MFNILNVLPHGGPAWPKHVVHILDLPLFLLDTLRSVSC
jgi:hypothetical protein